MVRPSSRQDTDRRLALLLVESRRLPQAAVERVAQENAARHARGEETGSLAETLCDRGLLPRPEAAELEARAEALTQHGSRPTEPPLRLGPLPPGTELGPFRIVSELGRGGMGIVYRAFDNRLRREVALKTLSGVADLEDIRRFEREARSAGRLNHPGIVRVLDAQLAGGIRVIALELVEGTSLGRKIKEKGPLPPQEAAGLVREVALAVHAAHEAGIVHRDLKPANVLLDTQGTPRLTDFGLARDAQSTALTATGQAMGTPAYMAPEQATASFDAIGPVTDVYGLGAILYDCLAARAPFTGPTGLAVMRDVIDKDLEPPSRPRVAHGLAPVPRDLETICLKALEKKPARRYPSALALAEDLGRYVRGEPVLARPIGRLERVARWTRRRPLVPALAAACLLAAALPLAVLAARERAERRLQDRQTESKRLEREAALAAAGERLGSLEMRAKSCPYKEIPVILTAAQAQLEEAAGLARDGDSRATALHVRAASAVAGLWLRRQDSYYEPASAAVSGVHLSKDDPAALRAIADLRARVSRREAACGVQKNALVAAANKDWKVAIALHTQALQTDPDWALEWYHLAHALSATQAWDDALASLDRAVACEPTWALAWAARALARVSRGDTEQALEDAKHAVELDRDSAAAYYARGVALGRLGRNEGAIEDLKHVTEIDPSSDFAKYARSFLAQGKVTR